MTATEYAFHPARVDMFVRAMARASLAAEMFKASHPDIDIRVDACCIERLGDEDTAAELPAIVFEARSERFEPLGSLYFDCDTTADRMAASLESFFAYSPYPDDPETR